MGKNDRELFLLGRIQKGDRDAFDALFRLYYVPLCVQASRYVEDAEAENIVQDLMLYVWENRRRLDISTSLRSYLFTAVRNRALTLLGRSRRKAEVLGNMVRSMDFYFLPPACPLDELVALYDEAMAKLPAAVRETFEQSRFEGKTYKEIAEREGVSVKIIDHRIQKAVKYLRQELGGLLLEPF